MVSYWPNIHCHCPPCALQAFERIPTTTDFIYVDSTITMPFIYYVLGP